MALDPATTVFPQVREFLDEFSQSVSYNDSVPAPPPTPGSSTPASVSSVVASHTDSGITIAIAGNTVTISGKYTQAFLDKTWNYVPEGNAPTVIENVFYQDIPAKIDSLTSYNADKTTSITVTYTVNTSAGSAIITQIVENDWDAGKAQMFEVKSRGVY